MLRILMVASEAVPFAKTGGLADVVGALSPTLQALGHEVAVLMPRYAHISTHGLPRVYDDLYVWFGPNLHLCHIVKAVERDVSFYLLDCPHLYERDGIYGNAAGDYPDNHVRFAVLCRAALNVVRHLFRPDIIHLHDWQSALVPVYTNTLFLNDPTFIGPKTVFTIHNLGYQGIFPREVLPEIGLDADLYDPDRLEFHGQISFMKGGILHSDALTTVSRGYAREIQTPELGFGLDGILRKRSDRLFGIQNGVDYSEWDPASDLYIVAPYGPDNLEGKGACKGDLLAAFGLHAENMGRPLIGMISRLVDQKGFDLIEQIAGEMMAEDLAFIVLGTGDPKYEQMLQALAAAHPDRVGVRIAYDDQLAHKIEAGADIFLMPSLYEPSGLNQIYSLRYGTVPVVRATGGLDDTIEDGVTGFKFWDYSGAALMDALRTALQAWHDRDRWTQMMVEGMRRDFSWNRAAGEYMALYRRLAARTGAAAA